MELKSAKKFLLKINSGSDTNKHLFKKETIAAFKIFWDSEPTEKEFSKYATGMLITPSMFYYMMKSKCKCNV
jgi:hypothetical protein